MTAPFTARLERPEGIGTWTFAPIPPSFVRTAGLAVRDRVKGTVDGVPFRSTLLGRAGGLFVVVPSPIRSAIGKSAGDRVTFDIALDRSPVVLPVPADLRKAFSKDPVAKGNFAALPPSHRKAYLEWIAAAVRPETRARRVADSVERLRRGERLR